MNQGNKSLSWLLILICLIQQVNAQLKPLQPGDRLPPLLLEQINASQPIFSSNDFKGRLLLLDFWATYCLSCLEAMPKLDSLQKKYTGQLQVMLVSNQTKELLQRFLDKRADLLHRRTSLPLIFADTSLHQLFPHESLPHYVWITSDGIIRHITHGDEVNESNILAVLEGKPVNMQNKADAYLQVSAARPLFVGSNGGDGSAIVYYSMISKYVEGIPSISGVFNTMNGNSSYAIGFSQTIKELFQIAYNDFLNQWRVPDNRTLLQVADSSLYVFTIASKNHYENFYNYQLITPIKTRSEMQRLMQEDLKRYFNLEAGFEKKKTMCWVLQSLDTSLLASRGGPFIDDWDQPNFALRMHNSSLRDLERRFIYNIFDQSIHPFVNEIRMNGKIDLELVNFRKEDPSSIISALAKYRISLRLEEREIPVLVIRDRYLAACTINPADYKRIP